MTRVCRCSFDFVARISLIISQISAPQTITSRKSLIPLPFLTDPRILLTLPRTLLTILRILPDNLLTVTILPDSLLTIPQPILDLRKLRGSDLVDAPPFISPHELLIFD